MVEVVVDVVVEVVVDVVVEVKCAYDFWHHYFSYINLYNNRASCPERLHIPQLDLLRNNLLPGYLRFGICYAIYANRRAGKLQRQRSCNCKPERFRYCRPGHWLLQAGFNHYAGRNS